MSAQEIIEQLPKLTANELSRVQARLQELTSQTASRRRKGQKTLNKLLLKFAGAAKGLPADLAENHDHYLYGLPKRKP